MNVAVPLILGVLVDIFEGRTSLSPWVILLSFVCLRYLQGSGGLAAVRDVCLLSVLLCIGFVLSFSQSLWASVMQYSDRGGLFSSFSGKGRVNLTPYVEMSQLSFDHILNLSFSWHTRRKTGEILRVLDRGAAINHTLEVGFEAFKLRRFKQLTSYLANTFQHYPYFH